jgi:hypothetical protein
MEYYEKYKKYKNKYLDLKILLNTKKFIKSIPIQMDKSVYMTCLQRESIIVPVDSNIKYIGTHQATTCVIVLCFGKSYSMVAHFDTKSIALSFKNLILEFIKKCNSPIEVSFVGAYNNEISKVNMDNIYKIIEELPNVRIKVNCTGDYNTKIEDNIIRPAITAAAINIKTGEIVKPIFSEELDIKRMARLWTDDYTIPNIYENPNPLFGKWKYSKGEFERLLGLNDQELLKETSSSPDVEEKDYVNNMRLVLKYIVDIM